MTVEERLMINKLYLTAVNPLTDLNELITDCMNIIQSANETLWKLEEEHKIAQFNDTKLRLL